MSDPRRAPDDRPNSDSLSLIGGIQALQGEAMPDDQGAFLTPNEMEHRREQTQTEVDRGDAPDAPAGGLDTVQDLDGLASDDLRDGETDDPEVAAQEGLTYVLPSEPREADDDGDPTTSDLAPSGDLAEQIEAALQADPSTSTLDARLRIRTRGRTLILRGIVDDIDDADSVVAVLEGIDGIDEVIDETELADG